MVTWHGHLLDIALFIAVVIADAYGLVPLSQTVLLVPLVWVVLRLRREPWGSIGFTRPTRLLRTVAIGIIAGLVVEWFANVVTTPLIREVFGVEPDLSDLKSIQGNIMMLLVFLGLNWTLAAFGEELCFRGFLMKRLAQVFGEGRVAWTASLVLASLLFGWGHTEQGIAGWVQEGLSGLLLGVLFLASGRNLAVPIVAHGTSNTVAFILIYFGRYPGLGS